MQTDPETHSLARMVRRSLLGLLAFCLLASPSWISAATTAQSKPLELILVRENEPWLLLAATPVAACLRQQGAVPILLAVPGELSEGLQRQTEGLLPFCRSATVITSDRDTWAFDYNVGAVAINSISGPETTGLTLRLARQYWRQTEAAVLCRTDEPEWGLRGAALAAHHKIPFIAYDTDRTLPTIAAHLEEMGVATVFVATGRSQIKASLGRFDVIAMNPEMAVDRTVEAIGAERITNIIVARPPNARAGVGTASWMAPYLSLMRQAPICLSKTQAACDVETHVETMIEQYALRPATVTILADYESIGTRRVDSQELLSEYEVDIEPCSGTLDDNAAPYGVGRIPCRRLSHASAMISAGFARETILCNSPARVLVLANPNVGYGSLPLGELISRATAEEFRNFGLHVEDHYGQSATRRDAVDVAVHAQLIVYEGHTSGQQLFRDPYDEYDGFEDTDTWNHSVLEETAVRDSVYEPSARDYSPNTPYMTDYQAVPEAFNGTAVVEQQDPDPYAEEAFWPPAPLTRLEGWPVAVLQSCHSLNQSVFDRLGEAGGIGMVGSTTSVHSASGSAFVKAFGDGLLYRGDTAGEALRDARNYLFCLCKLKQRRGHQETAKAYRAALSFRFWGDPELRLFSYSTKPHWEPISAEMVPPALIRISTPRHRLGELENERYCARLFPGSELAGVVKRLKDRPIRRVMSFYFFRLPRPAGFDLQGSGGLTRQGDSPNRAVYLTDPLKRFIYVLYFPETEAKSETFTLQFAD